MAMSTTQASPVTYAQATAAFRPGNLPATQFLQTQFRIGSVHGRVHYEQGERVFHASDVPPAARAAKEEVIRASLAPALMDRPPAWRKETKSGVSVGYHAGVAWDTKEGADAHRTGCALDAQGRNQDREATLSATVSAVRAEAVRARAVRATDTCGASLRGDAQAALLGDAGAAALVSAAARGERNTAWNASTTLDRRVLSVQNTFGPADAHQQQHQQGSQFLGPAGSRGVLDGTRAILPHASAPSAAAAPSLVARHEAEIEAQRAAKRAASAAASEAAAGAHVRTLVERGRIDALLPRSYGGRTREEEAAMRAAAGAELAARYNKDALDAFLQQQEQEQGAATLRSPFGPAKATTTYAAAVAGTATTTSSATLSSSPSWPVPFGADVAPSASRQGLAAFAVPARVRVPNLAVTAGPAPRSAGSASTSTSAGGDGLDAFLAPQLSPARLHALGLPRYTDSDRTPAQTERAQAQGPVMSSGGAAKKVALPQGSGAAPGQQRKGSGKGGKGAARWAHLDRPAGWRDPAPLYRSLDTSTVDDGVVLSDDEA